MAKTLDEAGVKRLIQEIKGANKNLNTPIPILTENTTESMAQNVKNIADYVEKAKAAGVDTTKSFRLTLEIDDYSVEGSYDPSHGCIYGLELTDDGFAYLDVVNTTVGNVYFHIEFITPNSEQKVTSSMLAQGARKPIILTSNTTEVDEETYQKLLSDDVDVVFKMDNGNLCLLTSKYDSGSLYTLYFTCSSVAGETDNDVYLYGYEVTITKFSPHTCSVSENLNADFASFLTQAGFFNKDVLYRVLQEIDLTGTDADRKAKLDKFETDWKALTGATDLTGARFVGKIKSYNDDYSSVLFSLGTNGDNYLNNRYYAFTALSREDSTGAGDYMASVLVAVERSNGQMIYIEPTIDNVVKYNSQGGITLSNEADTMAAYANQRIVSNYDYDEDRGDYLSRIKFEADGYPSVTVGGIDTPKISTDAANKAYVDNIQLQNTKSFEAITIKTGNTAADKAANLSAIKAYVDNLTALGVDTTKGYMIPVKLNNGYHGFIMGTGADGEHTGVIKRSIYSYGGGWIFIDNIGTYKYLESLTLGSYDNLTTTAKTIVPAINEVNTLAKGIKAFGAIELKASDNAANKAAVTAYLKILTDAGVSTTNGYSVPVRITGNSQEYHGMLNIGTGVLLSGVVTDVNENHHYPFNVSTTDGAILFDENNYFLEKGSNEVTEMLDAIKYSYTAVPFTDTTLSNKAQLEVFLSKVPAATVMHCTYKEIWAGTLHKINGDWYGLLVKNTNSPADNINVKLSADGTIVTSNSAQ